MQIKYSFTKSFVILVALTNRYGLRYLHYTVIYAVQNCDVEGQIVSNTLANAIGYTWELTLEMTVDLASTGKQLLMCFYCRI